MRPGHAVLLGLLALPSWAQVRPSLAFSDTDPAGVESAVWQSGAALEAQEQVTVHLVLEPGAAEALDDGRTAVIDL